MKNSANSAKKAVRSFLMAYKELDHEKMYEASTPTWRSQNKMEVLKDIYVHSLPGYNMISVKKITPVVYDVVVKLTATDGWTKVMFRTICESGPFTPSIDGEFKVNPVSMRKVE